MFIPETSLPNSLYVPFYVPSNRKVTTISEFALESNAQGLQSIINLMDTGGKKIVPFFDLSKYDGERQQWMWEDADGLFYKLIYYEDQEFQYLSSDPYDIYIFSCVDLDRDIPIQIFQPEVYNNTAYANFNKRQYVTWNSENFYKYDPIQIIINGQRLTDITDYNGLSQVPLNDIQTNSNREFYYNFIDNKIYTNQNMAGVQPNSVEIKFFTTVNTVQVMNKMATNIGTDSTYTPAIDYYIVKLNGQNFRNL